MGIEYDTTTIKSTISQSQQGSLVLPQFQRGFDWSHSQQESLLSSILAQLPIGGLLVLEGPRDALASRSFVTQPDVAPREDVTYLLDGQQRLTCTSTFFSDIFQPHSSWRDHHRQVPASLCYRWFLRIAPQRSGGEDYFGIAQLHFERDAAEPETFTDLIHSEKINRTEKSLKHWHPGWWEDRKPSDNLQIQAARHEAAESFATEGLVPLWELCGDVDGTPLHETTLRLIATRAYEQFISLGNDIPETVMLRLLEHRPDLAGTLNSNLEEERASALRDMAADWRADVLKYLQETVEQHIARIVLPMEEISRSVSIFETTNRGGTPLSTYDLVPR